MADKLAANLLGASEVFIKGDMSAKLKLLGVDVASFGEYELGDDEATPFVYADPFQDVCECAVLPRLSAGICLTQAVAVHRQKATVQQRWAKTPGWNSGWRHYRLRQAEQYGESGHSANLAAGRAGNRQI